MPRGVIAFFFFFLLYISIEFFLESVSFPHFFFRNKSSSKQTLYFYSINCSSTSILYHQIKAPRKLHSLALDNEDFENTSRQRVENSYSRDLE